MKLVEEISYHAMEAYEYLKNDGKVDVLDYDAVTGSASIIDAYDLARLNEVQFELLLENYRKLLRIYGLLDDQ